MRRIAGIFKAYDIRGVYPTEINEEIAYKVGRAFVQQFKLKSVVVGKDMRASGESLFKELARGITDQGADVIDIGMVATPMMGTTVARHKYDGGIMISASHNPGKYNAFKLVIAPCEQLSPDSGMHEIEALCNKGTFDDASTKGSIKKLDVLQEYIDAVLAHGQNVTGLKVVVDYGNGVGSIPGEPMFKQMDIEYIPMYEQPDGEFPNHPANPHDLENLKDLQERVVKEQADVGIFFDGDADRSYLVDEKGKIVTADFLLGMFAEEELQNAKGEKVYFDLRFSKAIEDAIKEAGGVPVRMRVGNPFYKHVLIHEGGLMGGEFSGHVMFKENHFQDDGVFAAVFAMSIMCKKKKALSTLIDKYRVYFQSPEINLTVTDPDEIFETVRDAYKDGKSQDIDGIWIDYGTWWFSLRKSNTEPLVRLRIEADTAELLEEKQNELLALIKND